MLLIDSPAYADDAGALGLLIRRLEVEIIYRPFSFLGGGGKERDGGLMGFASLLSRNLQINTAIAQFSSVKSIKDSLAKIPACLLSNVEQIRYWMT